MEIETIKWNCDRRKNRNRIYFIAATLRRTSERENVPIRFDKIAFIIFRKGMINYPDLVRLRRRDFYQPVTTCNPILVKRLVM